MASPILCEHAHASNSTWQLYGYDKVTMKSGL